MQHASGQPETRKAHSGTDVIQPRPAELKTVGQILRQDRGLGVMGDNDPIDGLSSKLVPEKMTNGTKPPPAGAEGGGGGGGGWGESVMETTAEQDHLCRTDESKAYRVLPAGRKMQGSLACYTPTGTEKQSVM